MIKLKSPFDKNESNNKTFDLYKSFLEVKINKIKKFNNNYELDLKNYSETIDNVYNKLIKNDIVKILIFGFIQSGKTDFLIGIICKLFSEKNSFIFVSFNQPNNELLNQTYNRVKEIYNKNIYRFSDILKKFNDISTKLLNGENIIILCMKEKNHLTKLKEMFVKLNEENVVYKSCIADDEGDTISFDNVNIDNNTVIFKLISDILEISKSNYLSITATPFAHVLLNINDNLKPDYCYLLQPSTGYVGLDYYIRKYNEDYKNNFLIINAIHKNEIDELYFNDDLLNALKYYLVQCYWWTFLKKNETKPRMIINIHKKKDAHENILDSVNSILLELKNKNNFDSFKDIFINLDIDIKELNNFIKVYNEIIKKISICVFNGDNKENKNFDKSELNNYCIIIGHTKIDRGLTIADLINTFITSRSNLHANADSILQQARFLGYRNSYKEKIRIFLTEELKQDYITINNLINFFMSLIKRNDDFSKIDNYIPIDNYYNLYATRSSVAFVEYIDGNQKTEFIYNVYNKKENDIEKNNCIFYNYFIKHNIKNVDHKNHKYIILENYKEFSSFIEIKNKNIYINFIETLFGNDRLLKQYMNIFMDEKYKFYIRLLNLNKRKIFQQVENNNLYNIGKGSYSSNDYEFSSIDNVISIDIIPINIYDESKSIDKIIYRARMFLPKDIVLKKGYIS